MGDPVTLRIEHRGRGHLCPEAANEQPTCLRQSAMGGVIQDAGNTLVT